MRQRDIDMLPDEQMQSQIEQMNPAQVMEVIRECNEITNKMQREIQEFYKLETNFLTNLPRELINAILEHQNHNAR